MKRFVITYIETVERVEYISALNQETAIKLAEMMAHQTNRKIKEIAETIDMNKFLCEQKES